MSFSTSPSSSLRDRDAGPLGHHLGDVFLFHLFLQHPHVALQLVQALVLGDQLPSRRPVCGRSAVRRPSAGRPSRSARSASVLTWSICSLTAWILPMASFSACQWAFSAGRLLAQVGQLGLDGLAPLLGSRVLLLAQGVKLDVELLDAPLHLVDLHRHRIDLDAQPAGRFVHQVDGLVGQEPVGDVAVGEHGRRDERRVLDAHAVVHFVALLEPTQDGDGVLHRRLARPAPAGSAAPEPHPSPRTCGTHRASSRPPPAALRGRA